MDKIFREYDIRGIVGQDLTPDLAEELGKAFGTTLRRKHLCQIAVGRDGRESSPLLRQRLVDGITATGIGVTDIGVCPTPLLYFALFNLSVDGGAMITASHNPAEYNGFKVCVGKETFYGEDLQKLRRMIEARDYETGTAPSVRSQEIIPLYLDYLKRHFSSVDARGIKVVVDSGNAMGALVGPQALKNMGCEVIELYSELDSRFPNHHPDPTVSENLKDLIETVRAKGADLGIAYDGDADRIGAVDERGEILWGDQLLVIFARDVLRRQRGAMILSEVKASQILYDDIVRHGGRAMMWRAGHSLIKSKMKETGALLAGEMSGHIFFADRYFGYDDAVYAGCRLIEILAEGRQPLSKLLSDLPKTSSTPEIRRDCPDDRKFLIVQKLKERFEALRSRPTPDSMPIRNLITIDGVRIVFDDGWGLVRASNTQPALVLRFEANTRDRMDAIRRFVEGELARIGT
ncbi:MAG: phosphomannomutase/phosphoglucomutase [Nitrospirae bacterium]|nr:phosphomannomutase/phosphoglucomutase [Nitrospirota bacterium]